MKTNKKTILATAVLLIVSALALGVSFTALANSNPADQMFEPAEETPVNLPAQVEAPRTVAEFQQQQSAYKHVEDGTVTLYSREQFDDIRAELESDGKAALGVQELNYLINDSLQLYRQNGEIVLTNAFTLPCFSYLFDEGYLSARKDSKATVLRRGDDAVIQPQSLTGIYFRGEGKAAEETELDLQAIIVYRVEMNTDALRSGSEKEEFNPGGSGIWRHTLSLDTTPHDDYYGPSSYISYKRVCMIGFEEDDYHYMYAWDMNGSDETSYQSSGTNGAAFYATETYMTDDSLPVGFKMVDMSDVNGKVAEGNRNDLMINGYRFNRNQLEWQTMDLLPDYDTQTRTALLPAEEYAFEIGMSYEELIRRYGIPYQSYAEGLIGFNMDTMQFTGNLETIPPVFIPNEPDLEKMYRVYAGFYVSTDGKLFKVYFSEDGSFTVTGFDCKDLF